MFFSVSDEFGDSCATGIVVPPTSSRRRKVVPMPPPSAEHPPIPSKFSSPLAVAPDTKMDDESESSPKRGKHSSRRRDRKHPLPETTEKAETVTPILTKGVPVSATTLQPTPSQLPKTTTVEIPETSGDTTVSSAPSSNKGPLSFPSSISTPVANSRVVSKLFDAFSKAKHAFEQNKRVSSSVALEKAGDRLQERMETEIDRLSELIAKAETEIVAFETKLEEIDRSQASVDEFLISKDSKRPRSLQAVIVQKPKPQSPPSRRDKSEEPDSDDENRSDGDDQSDDENRSDGDNRSDDDAHSS